MWDHVEIQKSKFQWFYRDHRYFFDRNISRPFWMIEWLEFRAWLTFSLPIYLKYSWVAHVSVLNVERHHTHVLAKFNDTINGWSPSYNTCLGWAIRSLNSASSFSFISDHMFLSERYFLSIPYFILNYMHSFLSYTNNSNI